MSDFGIASISIIPCRRGPSDAEEQVTQLLFGEHYEVIEQQRKWMKIRIAADGYECWIDIKQHTPLDAKIFAKLEKQKFIPVSADLAALVQRRSDDTIFPVLLGSSLPFLEGGSFRLGNAEYSFDGHAHFKSSKPTGEFVSQTAMVFMGAPYQWGGRSPFGVDCSGFTQICYKVAGMSIPRDAWQQQLLGTPLSFIEESKPGDLAFFDNEEGRIVHVGIMLDNHRIIHASGRVRIDRIDHQGIFNSEMRGYSHRLRIIRNLCD